MNSPYVELSDLVFIGKCAQDSVCEHALHIVGKASHTLILNNRFENFNAHIKANGIEFSSKRVFPNNVSIIGNSFINQWARNTDTPVTPLDIVGGDNWLVRDNFISDFSKLGGNQVAYGAFLKGGGNSGIFTHNFVACEWKVKHKTKSDVRVALSFGGGGTARSLCSNNNCIHEHTGGEMSGNTILNCPNSVGVYLNKSNDILIADNVILKTLGIKINEYSSSIKIKNNTIYGDVSDYSSLNIDLDKNQLIAY